MIVHCMEITLQNNYQFCVNNILRDTNVSVLPVVLVEEVTVLLLLLPNTAVTLTVQLLPALREVMVWVVAVPSTDDRYSSESHNS